MAIRELSNLDFSPPSRDWAIERKEKKALNVTFANPNLWRGRLVFDVWLIGDLVSGESREEHPLLRASINIRKSRKLFAGERKRDSFSLLGGIAAPNNKIRRKDVLCFGAGRGWRRISCFVCAWVRKRKSLDIVLATRTRELVKGKTDRKRNVGEQLSRDETSVSGNKRGTLYNPMQQACHIIIWRIC